MKTLSEKEETVYKCKGCGKEVSASWKLEKGLCNKCIKFPCRKCGKKKSKASGARAGFICEPCEIKERLEAVRRNAVATFKFEDAQLFKDLLQAVTEFSSEPMFKVSMDKIEVQVMDPSRVAMVRMVLPKHVFEELLVHSEGYMQVNLEAVIKLMKNLAHQTSVRFFIDGKDARLTMTLINGSRERERTFPLFEISEDPEPPPIPKLNHTAKVKLVASDFLKDIEELALVSDHITLEADRDLLIVKASGDVTAGKNKYGKGSDILIDIDVRDQAKAVFSISYFKEMIQTKICDLVTLEWASDMPIYVDNQLKFGDAELSYYLAPRIETE